jgi:2-dehydro-3-deoxyphosphooctonate aldolase (KDO 8-P synthase)
MNLCGFEVGNDRPFFLIAGPCVVESLQLQLDTAGALKEITGRLGIPFIFKSSFDKANRSSGKSFRGPGMEENNLVSDMRSLVVMRDTGAPVVFDATHSVQLPGGQGDSSGGQREFVPALSRAAVAVGVAGVFMETHPDPDKALSDGPNAWPLPKMEALLTLLRDFDRIAKQPAAL